MKESKPIYVWGIYRKIGTFEYRLVDYDNTRLYAKWLIRDLWAYCKPRIIPTRLDKIPLKLLRGNDRKRLG